MQQRLISENMLQCNYSGSPYFSAHGKYIAFEALSNQKEEQNSCIRIRTFSKQIKQCQISHDDMKINSQNKNILNFFFSSYQQKSYLIIFNKSIARVYLYVVRDDGKEIIAEKLEIFDKIHAVSENVEYLLFAKEIINDETNLQISGYDYKADKIVSHIGKCKKQQIMNGGNLVSHQGKNVYFYIPASSQLKKLKHQLIIFKKQSDEFIKQQFQFDCHIKFLQIYKDRYVFNADLEKKQVQIFDLSEQKIIGKFCLGMGDLVHNELKGNIFLLITNNSNIDSYNFYMLSKTITSENKTLITNNCIYEKGKGVYYQFSNFRNIQACEILQGKGKSAPENVNGIVSLIYMIPKNKQKVQAMKICHEKFNENNFGEDKIDEIIKSKNNKQKKAQQEKKNIKAAEKVQMEDCRFQASRSYRKSQKNLEDIQKKLIEQLIDIKMKGIIDKFDRLEKKLSTLQQHIVVIYQRMEKEIQRINRQEIKRSVQNLFEKVTPQFQTYFTEVFRQISGVMEQGQSYYKSKLAKEADMHRDALSKMINMTFDATKEIISLGHKELKLSENTNASVQKLVEIHEKWKADTKKCVQNEYQALKYKGPSQKDLKISLQPDKPKKQGSQPEKK